MKMKSYSNNYINSVSYRFIQELESIIKTICHKEHILGFPVNLQTAKHQISTFSNCAKEKKGKNDNNNPGSNADGEGDHVDLG